MNTVEAAINILNTFNEVSPGVAQLVLMIRRKDGTVSVVALLDEAEETFKKNMDSAATWLAAHPKEN